MIQHLPVSIRRKLRRLRGYRYRFIHYVLPELIPELLAGAATLAFFMLLPIMAAFFM